MKWHNNIKFGFILTLLVLQKVYCQEDFAEMEVVYTLPEMEEVSVRKNVGYKGNLSMDLYYPPQINERTLLPAVIFVLGYPDSTMIKGLGAKLKDIGAYTSWAKLTAASGMIAVTYETQQPVRDLDDLINYLREHAKTLQINKDKIGFWSCSGNVPVALSYLSKNKPNFLKFGVFYYGVMPTPDNRYQEQIDLVAKDYGFVNPVLEDALPADIPLLIVKAGQDEIPYVNPSIDHFLTTGFSKNLPITFINYARGQHAFDLYNHNQRTRDIIEETLLFMKRGVDPPLFVEKIPTKRIYHGMVYHSATGKILLFGGQSKHQWFADLEDVWSYHIKNGWEYEGEFEGVPPEGSAQYPAYDSESDRVIVLNTDGETWAYDYKNRKWEEMKPRVSPPGRAGHKMKYDIESDRIILFGGFGGTSMDDPIFKDTWSYDYNTNTWTNMNPANAPEKRMYYVMAYDAESDRMVMWGGRIFEKVVDNTIWTYDYNANEWERLPVTKGPKSALTYSQMCYWGAKDKMVIYGGATLETTFSGDVVNPVWSYDLNVNSWEKLDPVNPTVKKALHSMVYNPVDDNFIIFGGETDSLYSNVINNETWILNATHKKWKRKD